MNQNKHIAIIGGGAAGFFFAANASELYPNYRFTIYERGKNVLQKVKISGGGRCNVTNTISEPDDLTTYYPRGEKELLGPFYSFSTDSTQRWFEKRGVALKTEEDGRVFPVTDSSQTIIDCLLEICEKNNVTIQTSTAVRNILPVNNGKDGFELVLNNRANTKAEKVFLATGSSKTIWEKLAALGHTIIPPVPSLFTFQVTDSRINSLPGVSVEYTSVRIKNTDFSSSGPLLITHKGFSGPAVLKLSAFAARWFYKKDYQTDILINFLPELTISDLKKIREKEGSHLISNYKLFSLPKRLFKRLINSAEVNEQLKWASASNKDLEVIYSALCKATFSVTGQNRFKEEFVTAGGVDLLDIDFTNFSSKRTNNLFMAGEVLNIDAVTGGFNFQSAWTGAYLAALGLFD